MPAHDLRLLLARTLIDAGPDGPTLCEGWRTRHLAAHLVLREHESWRMAGLLIPRLRPAVEERTMAMGDAAAEPDAYGRLVQRFANGPAAFSPWRLIDDQANVLEYAVHREDVRRADPASGSEGRVGGDDPYSQDQLQEIWRHFRGRATLMFRGEKARVAIIVDEADGGGRLAVGTLDKTRPLIVVRGSVIDLVLFAFGRPAELRIAGADDAVAAFRGARRGV